VKPKIQGGSTVSPGAAKAPCDPWQQEIHRRVPVPAQVCELPDLPAALAEAGNFFVLF